MKNILTLLILAAAISSAGYAKNHHVSVEADKPQADTIEVDSLAKYTRLTDDDYRRVAEELGVELLGRIPLVQSIRESGDQGEPAALGTGPDGAAFIELAAKLAEKLS